MESLDNAFMEDSFGARDSFGQCKESVATPDYCLWAKGSSMEESSVVDNIRGNCEQNTRLSDEYKHKENVRKTGIKKGGRCMTSGLMTRKRRDKTTGRGGLNQFDVKHADTGNEYETDKMSAVNEPKFRKRISYNNSEMLRSKSDANRSTRSRPVVQELLHPIITNVNALNERAISAIVPGDLDLLVQQVESNLIVENDKLSHAACGTFRECRMASDRLISEQESFPSPAEMMTYHLVRRKLTRQLRRSSISLWSSDWAPVSGQSVDGRRTRVDNKQTGSDTSLSIMIESCAPTKQSNISPTSLEENICGPTLQLENTSPTSSDTASTDGYILPHKQHKSNLSKERETLINSCLTHVSPPLSPSSNRCNQSHQTVSLSPTHPENALSQQVLLDTRRTRNRPLLSHNAHTISDNEPLISHISPEGLICTAAASTKEPCFKLESLSKTSEQSASRSSDLESLVSDQEPILQSTSESQIITTSPSSIQSETPSNTTSESSVLSESSSDPSASSSTERLDGTLDERGKDLPVLNTKVASKKRKREEDAQRVIDARHSQRLRRTSIQLFRMSLAEEEEEVEVVSPSESLTAFEDSGDIDGVEECGSLVSTPQWGDVVSAPQGGDVVSDSQEGVVDSPFFLSSDFISLSVESMSYMSPEKSVQLSPGVRSPKSSIKPESPLVVMERLEEDVLVTNDAVDITTLLKKAIIGSSFSSCCNESRRSTRTVGREVKTAVVMPPPTIQPTVKRRKLNVQSKTSALEDIYKNRLWRTQMPKERAWESIPERSESPPTTDPSTNEHLHPVFFSHRKEKRLINFELGPTKQKIKQRHSRVLAHRGWRPATNKKQKIVLEKNFEKLMASLEVPTVGTVSDECLTTVSQIEQTNSVTQLSNELSS